MAMIGAASKGCPGLARTPGSADDDPTGARPIGVFDLTSLELGTMVATTTVPIGLTDFPKAQRRTESFPKEGI
jgi:hypothetical protein